MMGETWRLGDLKSVHTKIENWYSQESSKIKYQTMADEHQTEEKVRIYHHELHKKKIKRTSILKLDTDAGIIQGHRNCANFQEKSISDLLLPSANLSATAQEELLKVVDPVFTKEDNEMQKKQ